MDNFFYEQNGTSSEDLNDWLDSITSSIDRSNGANKLPPVKKDLMRSFKQPLAVTNDIFIQEKLISYLKDNGKPYQAYQLARALNLSKKDINRNLYILESRQSVFKTDTSPVFWTIK